jgi:hypothetical protein
MGYGFGSLAGEDRYDLRENWIRQIQLIKFLCFIKAYKSFRNSSCVINYTRVNCATTTLLSKCDNNYS